MRCRNCDYALWALPARECPECGTPFLPSTYEFVPSSVRFCCPHCSQPYYGTSASGHLEPPAFDCANCGRPVHMDEMVLFPTEGLSEEQTLTEVMPWLDRAKRGRVRAWFSTVGMALVTPRKLIRLTPINSSLAQAWGFAILTWLIYTLLCMGIGVVLGALMFASFAGRGRGGAVFGVGGAFLLFTIAVPVVLILIWGAITHAVLRLTGRTASGPGRTYQAHCYSLGATALVAIPCVGIYLFLPALIWWAVSAILMTREGQKVHGGRATLAVLTFPAVVIGVSVAIALLADIGPTMAMRMRVLPTSAPVQSRGAGTQDVLDAVLSYAARNNGMGPDHAVRFLVEQDLNASELLAPGSMTGLADLRVGGATLDQTALVQNTSLIRQAVQAQPGPPVAYRLGDYVFTYRGIDVRRASGSLWLVVEAPLSGAAPPQNLGVGTVNGLVVSMPPQQFDIALKAQNALRALEGLAPIPDPRTVGVPATQAEAGPA